MHGVTDDSTDDAWADMFTTWYVLVDESYHALTTHHGRWRQRGPRPTCSARAVMTMALMSATFVHGKEALCLACIRQEHAAMVAHLVDDPRFPRRRRALRGVMAALRRISTSWLVAEDEGVRVVDRAPCPAGRTCAVGHA